MKDYSFRDYRHEIWRDHLAIKVFRSHQKYSDEKTSTSAIVSSITELISKETLQAGKDLLSVYVNGESGETLITVQLLEAVAAST